VASAGSATDKLSMTQVLRAIYQNCDATFHIRSLVWFSRASQIILGLDDSTIA